MRAARLAAALAAAVVGFCPLPAGAAVGRTAGSFAATPAGAAGYTVPLWTPPGIGRVAPDLALVYSSEARAGLAGQGWAVGGLSAITRCARTVAQDGSAAPADLTAADRFCLDGQRLRLTSGTWGADGSTYTTEVESYVRVTARGAAGTGPASFVVEQPDGRVYEYGSTADSRVEPASSVATARHWALAVVRDRAGNSLRYSYTEDAATGQHRVATIDYPFTASGQGPYYRVEFVAEPRAASDVVAGYAAGFAWRETQRLARIRVWANEAGWRLQRRYELAYETSATGRQRLATLTECDGTGICLAPTVFRYNDSSTGWATEVSSTLMPAPLDAAWVHWLRGSVGAADDLVYQSVERDQFWWVRGLGTPVAFGPGTTTVGRADVQPMDLDGDGREDLAYRVVAGGSTKVFVMRATGSGLAPAQLVATLAGTRQLLFADLDGDGLDELLHAAPGGTNVALRANTAGVLATADTVVHVLPVGQAFSAAPFAVHVAPARYRSLLRRADFNGDAREDVVLGSCTASLSPCATASTWRVLTPGGAGAGMLTERATLASAGLPLLLDANGDGLTDLAASTATGAVSLRFGTGVGVSLETATSAVVASFGLALATDGNGDGLTDLLYPSGTRWNLLTSTGEGFSAAQATALTYTSGQQRRLFRLGDAVTGIETNGYVLSGRLRRNDPVLAVAPDVLRSALDGFGVGASDLTYEGTGYEYLPVPHARGLGAPRWRLSSAARTDGSGTDQRIESAWGYESPRIDRQGRGFLGYGRVTSSDIDAFQLGATSTAVDYHQDFPLTGRVKTARLLGASGNPLSEVELEWATLALGSGGESRAYPYAARSTRREWETGLAYGLHYVGGPFAVEQRAVNAIDPLSGLVTDATTVTTTTAKLFGTSSSRTRRVVHTSVLDDTAHWCLGRPLATEVTQGHSLAGGSARTRRSASTWDGTLCRLSEASVEPGDPAWQVVVGLGYDSFGNLARQTVTGAGLAPRVTRVDFGTRGLFIEAVTDALGQTDRYNWRLGLGLPASATDPNGLVTTWTWDGFGRRLQETRPDGTRTKTDLADCGSGQCGVGAFRYRVTVSELDTSGVPFRADEQLYDRHGRLVSTRLQSAGGWRSVVTRRFDPRGRVIDETLPAIEGSAAPGRIAWEYDERDRVVARARYDATGHAESSEAWANSGFDFNVTDPRGQVTYFERTAWGDLLRSSDMTSGVTSYEHDAFGNLLRVIDAVGNVAASMSWNVRGMKLAQADLDAGDWAWQVDALGEVTAVRAPDTAATGWTTTWTYDALGRVTGRSDAEGTSRWTFGSSAAAHNVERLVAVAGPGYSEAYDYDAVGRPARYTVTSDATYSYDYTWGTQGALQTITYPETTVGQRLRLRYEYVYGELTAIRDAANTATVPWQLRAVDPARHPIDELLGNGVRVVHDFDPVTGRLEARSATVESGIHAGGPPLAQMQYAWDPNGNLASRADLRRGLTETFGYDSLDRLVEGRLNGTTNLGVAYDQTGDITWKSDVGNYTYHGSRRHAVTQAGPHSLAYDVRGQVTSRDGAAITWTSQGLPRTLAGPDGATSQFWYGPDGTRFRQASTTGGVGEQTIYAGGLLEKVTRGGQMEWRQYIAAPTGTAAIYVRRSDGTAETFYLTHDHLGGTQLVLDAVGAVVKVEEGFDAFGRRRGSDWRSPPTPADAAAIAATTRDGYTGHEHLDGLGLIHMNGRVYDPVVGRFLSPDPEVQAPWSGQAFNRYAYAFNNPLSYTDPSGLEASPADGASGNPLEPPVSLPDNGVILWWGDGTYYLMPNFNRGAFCTSGCLASDRASEIRALDAAHAATAARRIVHDPGASFRSFGDLLDGLRHRAWILGMQSTLLQLPGYDLGIAGLAQLAGQLYPAPDTPEGALGDDLGPAVLLAASIGRGGARSAPGLLPSVRAALPSTRGMIRGFVQEADQVYYRVYSANGVGKWLTSVRPTSAAWAREALALPPGNQATFVQKVVVPAGTRLERSRAAPMPDWGRTRGGAEQFKLLDEIPRGNFGPGEPLP